MAVYHQEASKEVECYFCSEKRICEIYVADHPEAETGYVDEWAVCEECKNGPPDHSKGERSK